jgi:hypothetical protein
MLMRSLLALLIPDTYSSTTSILYPKGPGKRFEMDLVAPTEYHQTATWKMKIASI